MVYTQIVNEFNIIDFRCPRGGGKCPLHWSFPALSLCRRRSLSPVANKCRPSTILLTTAIHARILAANFRPFSNRPTSNQNRLPLGHVMHSDTGICYRRPTSNSDRNSRGKFKLKKHADRSSRCKTVTHNR